jgi:hypothetical protein
MGPAAASEPASFCTITTSETAAEFVGFLLSLSVHHRDARVYVLCDAPSKRAYDALTPVPRLRVAWRVALDKYTGTTRAVMEGAGTWAQFQMCKADAIEFALESSPDVLFMDCDTLLMGKVDRIDKTKQLGVSDQYLREEYALRYGRYNGGFLWTSSPDVPRDWRTFTAASRYYDQASIEDLVRKYAHFVAPEAYNIQHWRFALGERSREEHERAVTVRDGAVLYDGAEVAFVHTHFTARTAFNDFFVRKLTEARRYRELAIISRVLNGKWVVRVPRQPLAGLWFHKNDSYRELLRLVHEAASDVEVLDDPAVRHCTLDPGIVLYDRPTLEWYSVECAASPLLLLGNGSMEVEGRRLAEAGCNVRPWIFWPRRPRVLEAYVASHRIPPYDERPTRVVFIGNHENAVQREFRKPGWESVVDKWHLSEGPVHAFTQEEYLAQLAGALYGLCLRGYGSKCHREVELMALGCVPLVTPEVSLSYSDPLVEGVHYHRVASRDDVARLHQTSAEWQRMSDACRAWYARNVHSAATMASTLAMVLYSG